MINLTIVFSIIIIHFVADFVFQTHWQASNKSKRWDALIKHTSVYSICWIPFCMYLDMYMTPFVIITFITHTITDYFTSRLNTKLWQKGEIHNFFVSVGFDQVLHYIQLFLTYKLLI